MSVDDFPGVVMRVSNGNHGAPSYVLDDAQKSWLCKWFPLVENSVIMKKSGMSVWCVRRFAEELCLKKSDAGMRGINKRRAKKAARTCERNGFYDSKRGCGMPAAMRAGLMRRVRDVREGRCESSLAILKRKDPKRYARMLEQKREKMRSLIANENKRLFYGLKLKSGLHIVQCKYSKRQIMHRCNARRRGYLLMDDMSDAGGERYNIYYDSDTNRSDIFERNLINDGFRVIEWHEKS